MIIRCFLNEDDENKMRFENLMKQILQLIKSRSVIIKTRKIVYKMKKMTTLMKKKKVDYEKKCQRIFHQFVENDEISRRKIDLKCRC